MNPIQPEIVDPLVAWARSTPEIRRVWIFGTHASGREDADGDLDVAVETVPVADSDETVTRWMAKAERWRADLQSRIPMKVDLQWFDPNGGTPQAKQALDEAAVLVYDLANPAESGKGAGRPG